MNCLNEIKAWISATSYGLMRVRWNFNFELSNLGELTPFCKPVVKNLGVLFKNLKFDKQINSIFKSVFFF